MTLAKKIKPQPARKSKTNNNKKKQNTQLKQTTYAICTNTTTVLFQLSACICVCITRYSRSPKWFLQKFPSARTAFRSKTTTPSLSNNGGWKKIKRSDHIFYAGLTWNLKFVLALKCEHPFHRVPDSKLKKVKTKQCLNTSFRRLKPSGQESRHLPLFKEQKKNTKRGVTSNLMNWNEVFRQIWKQLYKMAFTDERCYGCNSQVLTVKKNKGCGHRYNINISLAR